MKGCHFNAQKYFVLLSAKCKGKMICAHYNSVIDHTKTFYQKSEKVSIFDVAYFQLIPEQKELCFIRLAIHKFQIYCSNATGTK